MRRALICFTRPQVPGRTKTRLMPLLNGEACAALHTAFLRDIAGVCGQVDADLYAACARRGTGARWKGFSPPPWMFSPRPGRGWGSGCTRLWPGSSRWSMRAACS